MNLNFKYLLISTSIAVLLTTQVLANHFNSPFTSPFTMFLFSNNFFINGEKAQLEDEIAVFDKQGVLCGKSIVSTIGTFVLPVYGDEENTSDDEGAITGEKLTFIVWDNSEQNEIHLNSSMLIQSPLLANDIELYPQIPNHPPQFEGDNTYFGLNIYAISESSLTIVTKNLPDGVVGQVYNFCIESEGGYSTQYNWTSDSNLESIGLSLSTNGILQGIPTKVFKGNININVEGDFQKISISYNLDIYGIKPELDDLIKILKVLSGFENIDLKPISNFYYDIEQDKIQLKDAIRIFQMISNF